MPIHRSIAVFMLANLAATSCAAGARDAEPDVVPPPYACPIFRNGFEAADASFRLPAPWATATVNLDFVTPGGYTIRIGTHTVTITDAMGMNTIQHWGDPHENLNGKHIKDWGGPAGWDGARRSVLLGDGSKVTMESSGWQGLILLTSIYAGGQNIQFDNAANEVVHRSTDPLDTQQRERAQYDGETALFRSSDATGIATYTNVYNENAQFEQASFAVPLGTTGGCDNPTQVSDLYDDSRLGHT